jgi:cytochrome c biogenesis protein
MSETVRNETLPPLSTGGWFRWIWRQFTSMRTALILLFLLTQATQRWDVYEQNYSLLFDLNALH